jgi:epoxyqueuosine reductase
VLIAIGNSEDMSLAGEAERLLGDQSPPVRGAAIWAMAQLMPRDQFAALAAKAIGTEGDGNVREEWRLELSP